MGFKKFYEENVIKLKGFGGADNAPVYELINQIQSWGFVNPVNDDQYIIDGVKLELEALNGNLHIKYIGALKKGRGNATMVMNDLIELVSEEENREHDIAITLNPHQVEETTKTQLIKWYKRLGFIEEGDYMIFYP